MIDLAKRKRITFRNHTFGGWITVLPSLDIYLSGPRRGFCLFPCKFDGVQIAIQWLTFELFLDFTKQMEEIEPW